MKDLRYLMCILLPIALAAIAALVVGCAMKAQLPPGGSYVSNIPSISVPGSLGGMPARTLAPEELWIIQRPAANQPKPDDRKDTQPGSGGLLAKLPGAASDAPPVPIPLKHTAVKADLLGYIGTVDVTQQYHNPFDTKIEAVYVFPLPHNAAINEFVMTIGDRKIRGIIREKQEAVQLYQQARAQGYVASLMTQERPNIFTQSVANIEPGKQIDVSIRYYHTLAYVDGWFEFVFPMVVGPRFNPPGSADGVGAVTRGTVAPISRSGPGAPGRTQESSATEVQYLRPTERSGHDISLSVQIDAGVKVENLRCRTHTVQVKEVDERRVSVDLASADSIPNKDFILRYQVAGKTPRSALFACRDPNAGGSNNSGYFTLMLLPPQQLDDSPRQPLEMVFTLDRSGSMDGRPIEQSKAAMRYALKHMNAGDTFQVIRFGDHAEKLFARPMPATDKEVARALRWIDDTAANEGTMMVEGMQASLNFPHDEGRLRYVAFLTDGFIGNERDVLRQIHQNLGPGRIFSFGVGSSPNRYLLEQMALAGNGAAAFLGLQDPADEVMAAFFDRISRPALTDISIDWGGLDVRELYPAPRIPDLIPGRPVILTGRYSGSLPASIKIKGRAGGRVQEVTVPLSPSPSTPGEGRGEGPPSFANAAQAIPALWARARIAHLADSAIWTDTPASEIAAQVRQTALTYGLLCDFTAFIAVDSSQRTQGDHGVTTPVPVPVPDGVRYETTIKETP